MKTKANIGIALVLTLTVTMVIGIILHLNMEQDEEIWQEETMVRSNKYSANNSVGLESVILK